MLTSDTDHCKTSRYRAVTEAVSKLGYPGLIHLESSTYGFRMAQVS